MGLVKFVIAFDRSMAVFFPGELITGRVIVAVDSPKETTGVYLNLKGTGYVYWSETYTISTTNQYGYNRFGQNIHNTRTRTHTRRYSAEETYCNLEACLTGGGGKFTIPPGEHSYPFSFVLPNVLPSSFEGNHGYVRYTAHAKIVRSWRFNHDIKQAITVNAIVDLNFNAQARLAPHNENMKTFGCLCCTSGPLSIKAHLEKGGFVPGETILINAVINNQSNTAIRNVVVKIHQCIRYQATDGSKSEVRIVAETMKEEIKPGEEQVWSKEPFPVPAIPPTNLGIGCNIIFVNYEVQLIAKTSGLHIDLKLSLPIVIGNIPIQLASENTIMSGQPMMTAHGHVVQAPPGQIHGTPIPSGQASAPPFPPNQYPDLPPPDYSECMFGAKNIRGEGDSEHTRGEKEFAPMYPTYGFANVPFNRESNM